MYFLSQSYLKVLIPVDWVQEAAKHLEEDIIPKINDEQKKAANILMDLSKPIWDLVSAFVEIGTELAECKARTTKCDNKKILLRITEIVNNIWLITEDLLVNVDWVQEGVKQLEDNIIPKNTAEQEKAANTLTDLSKPIWDFVYIVFKYTKAIVDDEKDKKQTVLDLSKRIRTAVDDLWLTINEVLELAIVKKTSESGK